MKKRILILLLATALLFVLSGCACEHQWLPADCTGPQTCASCGETQGEAAAHIWEPATCTAPETCEVCGATQGNTADHNWKDASCKAPKTCRTCGIEEGEVLPHSYELSGFDGDTMQYRCQVCSATSDQPIDRELYLQTVLTGHWDLFAVEKQNQRTSAMDMEEVGPYLYVTEDGVLHLQLEDELLLDLTWQFVEYQEVENSGLYTCNLLNLADQAQYPAVITENANGVQLSIALADNHTIVLQHNKLIENLITGIWHDFSHDRLYSLELNSDRTFTANFDDGISGTWHIKPMFTQSQGQSYDAFTLTLSYTLDEKPVIRNQAVSLGLAGEAMQVLTGSKPFYGNITLRDYKTKQFVYLTSPGMLPGEHTAIAKDAGKLLGNWETYEVTSYSYGAYSGSSEKTDSHKAVFHEDGTFELTTKETKTGSWYYICTTNETGLVYYQYTLKMDNSDMYIAFTLVPNGSNLVWRFNELASDGYTEYAFQKTA